MYKSVSNMDKSGKSAVKNEKKTIDKVYIM